MVVEVRAFGMFVILLLVSGCAGVRDEILPPNTLNAAERALGWQLLFDGESSTHWRGYRKSEFPEGWAIENGTIHVLAGGGGGDIVTTEKYRDFEFVVEWKVEEPNANSGIIYRVSESRGNSWETGPEMQIFGDPEPTTASTSAGGLYALYDTAEKVPMPLGMWNHARVVVVGNHVEHWLNGVKLLECEMHSADWYERVKASKFGDMPFFGTVGNGHIALQDHGNDVWFRNIKVRPISLAVAQGSEPIDLFNGDDLSGWSFVTKGDGDPAAPWSVEDGVMKCTGEPRGYARTEKDYHNYILELEWRWAAEPSNSGVLLRTVGEDKVWPKCIEAQLMNGRAGDFYALGGMELQSDPERTSRINVRHTEPNENPPGEWNHYRILVNGGKIELEVNGKLLNEAWECADVPGRICLQSEGTEIHFRNIRITPLLP